MEAAAIYLTVGLIVALAAYWVSGPLNGAEDPIVIALTVLFWPVLVATAIGYAVWFLGPGDSGN